MSRRGAVVSVAANGAQCPRFEPHMFLNGSRSAIGNEQDVCEPDEPTVTRQSAVQNSDTGTRYKRPQYTQRQWVNKDLHVDWPDFQVQPKTYIVSATSYSLNRTRVTSTTRTWVSVPVWF